MHPVANHLGEAALRAEPRRLSLAARTLLVCGAKKVKSAHWCGDRTQSTLWQVANLNPFGGSEEEATGHGTQKPVEFMRRPILNNSVRGDIIYDPFLGSGTTLVAAHSTERICFGLDIDPRYIDVAVQRWQKLTGQVAVLAADGRTFDQIAAERTVVEVA